MGTSRWSPAHWIKVGVAALFVAVLANAPHGSALIGLPPSWFLGAGPGVPVTFEPLALPSVAQPFGHDDPAPAFCPWAPTFDRLVNGDTVITSEDPMRYAWRRLFSEPFDPALFDFSVSFVVLMGDGLQTIAQFEISSVEQFEASYDCPFGPCLDGDEPALAVTATRLIPGVPPKEPRSRTYRLAAAKIPVPFLDDVVFHRVTFRAP